MFARSALVGALLVTAAPAIAQDMDLEIGPELSQGMLGKVDARVGQVTTSVGLLVRL